MDDLLQQHRIASYECGADALMRPECFMHFCQEMAEHHAELNGLGYDWGMSHHLIWVETQGDIEIIRRPRWKEVVTLRTNTGKASPLQARRFVEMTDADGKVLARADLMWVLIDVDTRRPMPLKRVQLDLAQECPPLITTPFPTPEEGETMIAAEGVPVEPSEGETMGAAGGVPVEPSEGMSTDAAEGASEGVAAETSEGASTEPTEGASKGKPDEKSAGKSAGASAPQTEVCTLVASRRDVDFNGHINNGSYFIWVTDTLPDSLIPDGEPRRIRINFRRESRRGDLIRLEHTRRGRQTQHLLSCNGETRCEVCILWQ